MSVLLNEKHSELVKKIAQDEGFQKYKIESSSGSLKGDGYLGIMSTVRITDDNSKRELNLVFKSALTGQDVRSMAPIRAAFERESYMYLTMFPEFLRMQIQRQVSEKFCGHATCYGSCMDENNEIIVLEDLRKNGYQLWDSFIPMEDHHISLVFKEYAKFHGVSFAMKHSNRKKYDKLTKELSNVFVISDEDMDDIVENVFDQAYMVIEDEQILGALRKFHSEAKHFIKEETTKVDENCVVTHGDCWNNNMMFKYGDVNNPETPTQVCFLDWQIARTASPILDLSYFMCVCGSRTVLTNFRKYLKVYHYTLQKTIQDHGVKEEVYSYDVFEQDWKKFAKYGLYLAFMIVKVMLMDEDEVPDLKSMPGENEQCSNQINQENNEDAYRERINYIAEFMYRNGFI